MDQRPRIDPVGDLVAQPHRRRETLDGSSGGAASPDPGLMHVLQADRVGEEHSHVFHVGVIEPSQLAEYPGVVHRPLAGRWGRRPQGDDGLADRFFDVSLPGRNAHHNDGSVQRRQFVLTASSSRSQPSMCTLQLLRILQQLSQVHRKCSRRHDNTLLLHSRGLPRNSVHIDLILAQLGQPIDEVIGQRCLRHHLGHGPF